MLVKDVINYFDKRFPKELAEEFDQKCIGLAMGNDENEVNNILLSLDLNLNVVNIAIKNKCNLIITHHPYFFNPIYKVSYKSNISKVLFLMIKHNISLYTMHTNLDAGKNGVNDSLANLIGLKNIHCINNYQKGNYLRIGTYEKEITLKELIMKIKDTFNLSGVRYLGDLNKSIKIIGIVGGSGGRAMDIINASKNKCDCYITGEVRLDASQLAEELGLSLIEINHGVEKYVFEFLKDEIQNDLFEQYNFSNEIFTNMCETDNLKTM